MLFDSITIKGLTLKNRIMMAPMCQYSAGSDGLANSWHFTHYTTRAIGGVGLIVFEATGVESRGRISNKDLGLWDDIQIPALKRIVEECKKYGAAVGIQLSHAGRKSEIKEEPCVAPSSVNWDQNYRVPEELSINEIHEIVGNFKKAAERANKAGFDIIEIHAAHGYLIHEFLSPLSNLRTDEYGGSRENRVRILNEILGAVKEVWPSDKPIFLRVSADDYTKGGIDIDEMIHILSCVNKDNVDLIDVSSGGLVSASINLYPGYQVSYSQKIKEEISIKTGAVGLITQAELAEDILRSRRADLVILGRELLRNPYWPLTAAKQLHTDIKWPVQYERARI